MPSLFNKKRTNSTHTTSSHQRHSSATSSPVERPDSPLPSPITTAGDRSPEKEKRSSRSGGGYFTKDRSKDRFPLSPRSSKSSGRSGNSRRGSDSHPLNLPPDELRRLSALSAMSNSPRSEREAPQASHDAMETSPAPEDQSQRRASNSEQTNGVNGDASSEGHTSQNGPAPPPHRTPTSPPAPQIRAEEAEVFKLAGNKFYKAAQYGSAIDEYTKAIEANPTSATYLSNRAAAYMANGQYPQALEDCKQADRIEPMQAKTLLRMAKIYTSLGQPDEALSTFDRIQPPASAKDRDPAVQMQRHITIARKTLENNSDGSAIALNALDQAEKLLGSSVVPPRRWRLLRGEAYLQTGNINSLGDAQSIAMSILRNNAADPEALVLRGRALYAEGEHQKAIQHFRQALAYDPDFKDGAKYLRLVQKLDRTKEEGNAHFKAGRYQAALDTYTLALDIDPLNKNTNSKILNNRAMCHARLKNHTSALADADAAIALDPDYLKAQKTRAKALGDTGDWEACVRAWKALAEAHPDEQSNLARDIRHAELELKKSKRKDYYKILGIEKTADDTDIKKAYRKLAIAFHPDKNRDDPEAAEAKFKDIQEAHETLIDPQKRQRYDSGVDLMEPGEGFGGFGGMGGMGGMGGGVQIDPEVLFNMMGGGGGRGGGRGGGFHQFGGGSPFGGGGGRQGFSFGGQSPFG